MTEFGQGLSHEEWQVLGIKSPSETISVEKLQQIYQNIRHGGLSIRQIKAALRTIMQNDDDGCSGLFFYDVLHELDRRYYLRQHLLWDFAMMDLLHTGFIDIKDATFLMQAVHKELFSHRQWKKFLQNRFKPSSKLSFEEMEVELCNIPSIEQLKQDQEEEKLENMERGKLLRLELEKRRSKLVGGKTILEKQREQEEARRKVEERKRAIEKEKAAIMQQTNAIEEEHNKRVAEEKRKIEEAIKRKNEEEAKKIAEDIEKSQKAILERKRQKAEAKKLAREAAEKEAELKRIEAERLEEEARLKRIEEEQRQIAEAKRVDEEMQVAEEKRKAEELAALELEKQQSQLAEEINAEEIQRQAEKAALAAATAEREAELAAEAALNAENEEIRKIQLEKEKVARAKAKKLAEEKLISELRSAMKLNDIEKLREALKEFQAAKIENSTELVEKANKLLKLWKIQNELKNAIKTRQIPQLEKALDKVIQADFATELSYECTEAQELLHRLKRLERMRHEILSLKQSTVAEIRSYQKPHVHIHNIMIATYILLGYQEKRLHDWKHMQALIGKTGKEGLKRQTTTIDPTNVTKQNSDRAEQLLQSLDVDSVRDLSSGAATFYVWCMNMIEEVNNIHNTKN